MCLGYLNIECEHDDLCHFKEYKQKKTMDKYLVKAIFVQCVYKVYFS